MNKIELFAYTGGIIFSLCGLIGFAYHWVLGTCSLITLVCFYIVAIQRDKVKEIKENKEVRE